MRIAISIPVHEKVDVIKNQIENFKKYIKNPVFILHISESFSRDKSWHELKNIKDVYINPNHLSTQWGNIISAHLSNFEYLDKIVEFDYILLHASNDMYIQSGIEEYIGQFDAGFNKRRIWHESMWWPAACALRDRTLQLIMIACGQSTIVASQIEGSFYKRDLFRKIVKYITQYYKEQPYQEIYTREEVYFSTVASNLVEYCYTGLPTTYSEVHIFDRKLWTMRKVMRRVYNSLFKFIVPKSIYNLLERIQNKVLFESKFYIITPKTVDRIRENDKKLLSNNQYLDDMPGKFKLYDQIFSVKRVSRDIDDTLRKYITKLD